MKFRYFLSLIILGLFYIFLQSQKLDKKEDSYQPEIITNDEFLKEQEKVMNERKKNVRRICNLHNMTFGSKTRRKTVDFHLLCIKQYKVCFCPNAKTGTTTWMHWIWSLTNVPEKLHKKWEPVWFIHAKMRALYLLSKALKFDERMQIVRYFDTFAFVRHPFVRLVSTFKDKIIDKNYRHWRELVNFNKTNHFQSFETFVQLLLKGKFSKNSHVMSYWKKCDMCHIRYDIIGKMETFVQDSKYVIDRAEMTPLRQFMQEKFHVSKGETTKQLTEKLFSQLPRQTIEDLYQYYALDFQMFDYDYRFYYDLGV